ncbi:MarR family transcriptional regulator [Methanohalobium sp.]|uniref:helix-turn-helix transcriptional regulator n=1 Tax=Methanohalobium sp. TaxID=2837493 RepID=UPI0025F40595|nr:MarR family transcriptional regulator [Methanohalobium sp.]
MEPEELALKVIKEHPEGIYQNQLWKEMNIDSRKCSRIVSKLLKKGLIIRESATSKGSRTYLLKSAEEPKPSYEMLLSGSMFSPCAGCRLACEPEFCEYLTEWIVKLDEEDETSQSEAQC